MKVGALIAVSVLSSSAVVANRSAGQSDEESDGLRCVFSNSSTSSNRKNFDKCKASTNAEGDGSPYCYALFKNDSHTGNVEAILRGCWVGGDCLAHARERGKDGACHSSTAGNGLHLFCCCVGEMCNENLQPSPSLAKRGRNVPVASANQPDEQRQFRSMLIYVIAPFCGFLAIFLLTVLGHLSRKQCLPTSSRLECPKSPASAQEQTLLLLPLTNVNLVREVAHGRFGTVWKATYHHSSVAVKISLAGQRQAWLNEVRIYRLLQPHSNILRFLGAGQQTSSDSALSEFWLLTTWHELGSLYDFLRVNTVSYCQLLHLADSLVRGVMQLHAELNATPYRTYKPAMAHRDIKSRNVILKDDRTACLADFGSAVVFDKSTKLGDLQAQAGTLRYMPPEVLEGAISFDQEAFQRIDMYAVSLVLWEILSRNADCSPHPAFRLPFEEYVGLNPSIIDMQEYVVNQKQRPGIKQVWREDRRLRVFVTSLEECWDADADARLSSSTMHERIHLLLKSQFSMEITHNEETTLLPAIEQTDNNSADSSFECV